MPFENTLNVRVARKHRDGVTVHFAVTPESLNNGGTLHGGITASIADEAAWHAIQTRFGYGARKSTTTELKINYLRPIVRGKVIARAYLVRVGQTLCVSRVDLFDEKKNLSAIATVTYMFLP